jgi:hypothetical protein
MPWRWGPSSVRCALFLDNLLTCHLSLSFVYVPIGEATHLLLVALLCTLLHAFRGPESGHCWVPLPSHAKKCQLGATLCTQQYLPACLQAP